MDITIPRRVVSNEIGYNWLAKVAHQLRVAWRDEIRFVGQNTSFFEGNLCAPLGALLHEAVANENRVAIGDDLPGPVLKVLSMNEFSRHFDGASMNDAFDTTIEYRQTPLTEDRKEFARYISQELMSKEFPENMSKSARESFARSIAEIFDNAVAHSGSPHGVFSCGQHFPKQHRLTFTLTDLGVGFRWNIERRYKARIDDMQAIRWAVERGHTTRAGGAGGSGLAQLRDFFARNGGRLQIVSGSGFWEIAGNVEKQTVLRHAFPGSFVNLEINTQDATIYTDRLSLAGGDVF